MEGDNFFSCYKLVDHADKQIAYLLALISGRREKCKNARAKQICTLLHSFQESWKQL